ncbi:MAG: ABC transporter ATP-binding protein [Sedimenticola sp.]
MKTTFSKIYNLLTSAKRKAAAMLLGFIFIGMLFEIIGVGLLLPVVMLIVENDLATSYPVTKQVLDVLGNPSHEMQIQLVMVVLIGVYMIKNLYLSFLAWHQARFSLGLQESLSQRLFALYMRQPYTFHLQRNSAHLIRNITSEIDLFIAYVLNPLLSLIAESLVLLGVVTLLLVVEPLGSLIVFLVLIMTVWLFHRSTRKRITRWGEKRQYHDAQRIQHLHQGLGGVKDVKLLGREADFIAQFHEHNSKSAQMAQFIEILQKLPRLWLELLAVVGLALLVLAMLTQGREISSIVPTMGLFAVAAFRLMPSVNRILNAIQSLRYGMPAIDKLYEDFQLAVVKPEAFSKVNHNSAELQKEICLSSITYNYPDSPFSALDNVSIKIQQGKSIGLIGPSGSGKSTLVDVILGLLTPDSGLVIVDGQDIQQSLRMWQDQIGYVPQSIYLTDDTLRRNIAFGLPNEHIDDEAVKRAIHAAQLEDFVISLPDGIESIVGERGIRLSGGQRQRIGIARALYHDPDVLVLDEATSALDNETEANAMQAVMALHGNKTVLIVAHRLSTVEHCDFLYRLEQGGIVEKGTPQELLLIN